MKIAVLYASMNGHTKVLAEGVAEGAKQVNGAEVILSAVEETDPDTLKEMAGIIWGSSGYFGEPNPKMSEFLGKLGGLWFTGALQGKVGGVFATASTQHGGVENVCRALQTPMQHHGMVIVSNTGPLNEDRANYGNPYGASAVIPVEESKDAPMNKPVEAEMKLASEFGKRVAETAAKISST
ncbi:NAD(P)H-dependent oxidoreductase [Alteribacter natronophilus]|uniref:NAD(P)H-dependent oxidoreductase n=1 Tax=Alteribacter natronophilus TaxID=2583810 RepID=UPI00110D5E0C|nr:NAD(P)H-dependent oxidoreductase [Alteribacter natronophilus]TMW73446.1 flavodoxin family protein [Alteribacter natronophilus]